MEKNTIYFRKGMLVLGVALIVMAKVLEIFFHLVSPLTAIIQLLTVLFCCLLVVLFLFEQNIVLVGAFVVIGVLYVFGLNICTFIRMLGIYLKERYR